MSRAILLIRIIFYSVFFIFPLLYIPGIFNPYELPKFAVLVTSSIALGTGLLFVYTFKRQFNLKLNLLDYQVIILLALLMIANSTGVNWVNSLYGSAYRIQGFVTYVSLAYIYVVVRITVQKSELIMNHVLSMQFLLVSLFLISQFVIDVFTDLSIATFQGRYHGHFGNPNFAGGYLAMLFGYILFSKKSSGILYHIKPLLILLGGIAVVLTDSRSAIAAVIVLIGIYFISSIKNIQGSGRFLFVCALLIVTFSGIFLAVHSGILQKRNSEWESRVIIWEEGVKLFLKRPMLGYGQENVQIIFPKNLHFPVDNIHNIFLEYAVSAGIFGVISLCLLLGSVLLKSDTPVRMLFLSFIISASLNPLSISQLFLFWVMLGIVGSKSYKTEK